MVRDRDPADRRAVVIRDLRGRNNELYRLYRGMNVALDEILADYGDAELNVLGGFLRRSADAGHIATSELAQREQPGEAR